MNVKIDWQKQFNMALDIIQLSICTAFVGFLLSAMFSIIYSPIDAFSHIRDNITIIGMLLSGVTAFAAFMTIKHAEMTKPITMNKEEQTKHEQSIYQMKICCAAFSSIAVICNVFTSGEALLSYFTGNILTELFLVLSFALIGFSLLNYKLANFIKLKHLNNLGDSK